MKLLSQYFDNGKLADVWMERDSEGTRYIVRILGEDDRHFDSEFAAQNFAEDYVQSTADILDINSMFQMEFPDMDIDVVDSGKITLKPAKLVEMNTKNRRRPKGE